MSAVSALGAAHRSFNGTPPGRGSSRSHEPDDSGSHQSPEYLRGDQAGGRTTQESEDRTIPFTLPPPRRLRCLLFVIDPSRDSLLGAPIPNNGPIPPEHYRRNRRATGRRSMQRPGSQQAPIRALHIRGGPRRGAVLGIELAEPQRPEDHRLLDANVLPVPQMNLAVTLRFNWRIGSTRAWADSYHTRDVPRCIQYTDRTPSRSQHPLYPDGGGADFVCGLLATLLGT